MIISKIILYVSTNDKLAHITYKQTNKFNKIYMLQKTAVGKMFVQESFVYSLMYRVQYFIEARACLNKLSKFVWKKQKYGMLER